MKYMNYLPGILVGIILFGYYALSGDNPTNTVRVLEKHGYKDIKCVGYSFFIGERSLNRTEFTAVAPNGVPVHGAVCYTFKPSAADIVIAGN